MTTTLTTTPVTTSTAVAAATTTAIAAIADAAGVSFETDRPGACPQPTDQP